MRVKEAEEMCMEALEALVLAREGGGAVVGDASDVGGGGLVLPGARAGLDALSGAYVGACRWMGGKRVALTVGKTHMNKTQSGCWRRCCPCPGRARLRCTRRWATPER